VFLSLSFRAFLGCWLPVYLGAYLEDGLKRRQHLIVNI